MTTTSTTATPAATPLAPFAPTAWPSWPAVGAGSEVPWELLTQAMTLQSTWWAACATMQARWLQDAAAAWAQAPTWAVWQRGMEQLA